MTYWAQGFGPAQGGKSSRVIFSGWEVHGGILGCILCVHAYSPLSNSECQQNSCKLQNANSIGGSTMWYSATVRDMLKVFVASLSIPISLSYIAIFRYCLSRSVRYTTQQWRMTQGRFTRLRTQEARENKTPVHRQETLQGLCRTICTTWWRPQTYRPSIRFPEKKKEDQPTTNSTNRFPPNQLLWKI